MATCPKCDYKLKITDISQYCPKCKVNMRFFGFEENFYREAKIAELSQAGILCKVRRLKTAFIGSKLTIARLIVMLLPAVALLLPSGSAQVALPYKVTDIPFSILGIVNLFTSGDLGYISSMTASPFAGAEFKKLQLAIFALLAVAFLAVVVFLTSLLCFISVKNMQKITSVVAALGIVGAVVSMIITSSFVLAVKNSAIVSGKNGFGMLAVIAMFGVVLAINLILSIKGIKVEYDEGMLERAEIYKKVKAGEVSIDDLPQPVVETAATRAIDEEIAKEEKAYKEKHMAGGESDDQG
ncbi:MAG: hypothetical protein MJ147_03260 [Clostridia bacterium]|nr:hypothetical protein [Clostridia bacterium]